MSGAHEWPGALAGLAAEPGVGEAFERSLTCEFATLTRAGAPVTTPTTPYVGPGGTLDVSTGLTYPAKAERARRDPRVCLTFADPLGPGAGLPVVVVQGLAAVRDADLQANTDRYAVESKRKLPAATEGQPRVVLRRLAWYYARIWVEVTPVRVRWWPDRSLAGAPGEWRNPGDTPAPMSDPAPAGKPPPPWLPVPTDWRQQAADALRRLPLWDLTVVEDGWPLCLPVVAERVLADGIVVTVGPGTTVPSGPACLTAHRHDERFTSQENRLFVGAVEADDEDRGGAEAGTPGRRLFLRVERAVADWSIPAGSRLQVGVGFLGKGRLLRPRLRAEAARRDQPVPKVRLP